MRCSYHCTQRHHRQRSRFDVITDDRTSSYKAIAISDLQVKNAELMRGRADLAGDSANVACGGELQVWGVGYGGVFGAVVGNGCEEGGDFEELDADAIAPGAVEVVGVGAGG